MALVGCKECKEKISTSANICPHCGIDDPSISYEEERLLGRIERSRETEQYYRDLEIQHSAGFMNWILSPIFGGIGKECNRRANYEVSARLQLEKELKNLRQRQT